MLKKYQATKLQYSVWTCIHKKGNLSARSPTMFLQICVLIRYERSQTTLHLELSRRIPVFVLVLFDKMRNSFIGEIHKSWSGNFVDKFGKQDSSRQIWRQASVKPDWSNQFITVNLIGQFNHEVIYHFTTVKWYHITFSHCSIALIFTYNAGM